MANETLYLNAKEGFAGTGLKRDGEPIGKCSTLDDIIYFNPEGFVTVSKVAPKLFVGKNPVHLDLFRKEEDPIYTVIYRDGRAGRIYAKRFRMGGVTRDKAYPITKGTAGSRILFFAEHDTEEESDAQTLSVHLKPALYLRNLILTLPISSLAIKSRSSLGNIVTKHSVDRIVRQKKES
jgi:topoisomerase-4 subunit A